MVDLPVIVLGAGGHARVVLSALFSMGIKVLGCVEKDDKRIGEKVHLGANIIGSEAKVLEYSPKEIFLVNGLGSVGVGNARRDCFVRFIDLGYSFCKVIHSKAIVESDVVLGEGCQIAAGVVVQTGTTIGRNVILNTGSLIDHDCEIGDHCHIAPGCVISGGVVIGMNTHVGVGASIIQGVQIGRGCLLGAGAVVTKSFPDNVVILGVPAEAHEPEKNK